MITFENATPETYAEWGMKSGLEIHQQLATKRKLFCRCPVLPYSDKVDAEILRHMRPTLSELGEYDGTALMEFKTKKNIIYQLDNRSVCTYEMDDTPPFELNREALDIALEIALLLDCNIVSELHVARKQYLDGSIPTGFQRTTIVGTDGKILVGDRWINVIQLGLEEDACREVSDIRHERYYRTDRLGIPLVETVTYPELRTPQEVAEAAQVIRYLTRATGKVRTGIGAARQDVNVSVAGGRRVEIKGVPKIKMIPRLVHNEALRQRSLLEIRDELHRQGIREDSFASSTHDVTDLLCSTAFAPLAGALADGWQVRAVVLRGFRGIFNRPTQPGTTFAKEVVDRVRVIACLDSFPNLIHSDASDSSLLSAEWSRLRRHVGCGDRDVMVVTWGPDADAARAAEEIAIRAREATVGIPDETRQALSDGTNGFERILPGPDRMYPDTDLPPMAVTEDMVENIKSQLPPRPWELEKKYRKMGIQPDWARKLSRSSAGRLFEQLCDETAVTAKDAARLVLVTLPRIQQRHPDQDMLDNDELIGIVQVVLTRTQNFSLVQTIIAGMIEGRWTNPDNALDNLHLTPLTTEEVTALIEEAISSPVVDTIPPAKRQRFLMGRLMAGIRGRFLACEVSRLLDERLGKQPPHTATAKPLPESQ